MGNTIYMSREAAGKCGLTIEEALCLLYISTAEKSFGEICQDLKEKGMMMESQDSLFKKLELTSDGIKRLNDVICAANPLTGGKQAQSRIERLIPQLQQLFPEGKKDGTSYYWRGNRKDIQRKLTQFFLRYQNYSDEEILDATERYVKSFNGDYSYMRLLQYFIWKVTLEDGKQLCQSDLASFIENKNQRDMRTGWNVKLK